MPKSNIEEFHSFTPSKRLVVGQMEGCLVIGLTDADENLLALGVDQAGFESLLNSLYNAAGALGWKAGRA